ncbi:MAG: putative oxidoreductase [Burkholderiales bacterium]|jgi:putative oxidoreductase
MNGSDLGKLILRVTLGILILLHGIAKITGGVSSITSSVAKLGLPAELGYLVYIGEVIAPVLLILGFWTRISAGIIAINMVVAVWIAHTSQLFELTKNGGWALELQGMFLMTAIALVFLGGGRYSLGANSRWN